MRKLLVGLSMMIFSGQISTLFAAPYSDWDSDSPKNWKTKVEGAGPLAKKYFVDESGNSLGWCNFRSL